MLSQKIKSNEAGIILYGIVPPKENLEQSKIKHLAFLQKERIENAGIDGIVIYDLQDESARTAQKRTFEFIKTIDPDVYYTKYLKTAMPAIIYRAVGKYDRENFAEILENSTSNLGVFVGASSRDQNIKLRLSDAYKIRKNVQKDMIIGGVCIPERQAGKHNEHLKVASKTVNGCEFFITQAVYNVENAKDFIDNYALLNIKKVPIIFTFTPCGSLKTLEFMKWLGIGIPDFLEQRLKNSVDILQSSVDLSIEIFEFLFKYARAKNISIGANVESISTRKVEIEASLSLLNGIKKILS